MHGQQLIEDDGLYLAPEGHIRALHAAKQVLQATLPCIMHNEHEGREYFTIYIPSGSTQATAERFDRMASELEQAIDLCTDPSSGGR